LPVSPVEVSSYLSSRPANYKNGNFLITLGVLALLFVVGGGGYYLGTQSTYNTQPTGINVNIPTPPYSPKPQQLSTTPLPSPTEMLSLPTSTRNAIVKAYEHPTAHYALEYPASWDGEIDPKGSGQARYETFALHSPDYQPLGPYDMKGALIRIFVEDTSEKSINNLKRGQWDHHLNNLTKTIVDGVEAIQFDIRDEGYATSTMFIKNGKFYDIWFYYADAAREQPEWNTYQSLLKSFKTK
jgi:hypothetical protein